MARNTSASIKAAQMSAAGEAVVARLVTDRDFAGAGRNGVIRMTQRWGAGEEKRPRIARGLDLKKSTSAYLSELLIEVNLPCKLLPRPLTTAIIASAMPAAIRPYSMAVAPDSSFTKRAIRFFIDNSMYTWLVELDLVSPAFSAP